MTAGEPFGCLVHGVVGYCIACHSTAPPAASEDSPDFVPKELAEFATRGYERINRDAPAASETEKACEACGRVGCKCAEFCNWYDDLTDEQTTEAEDNMQIAFEAGYAAGRREALEGCRPLIRLVSRLVSHYMDEEHLEMDMAEFYEFAIEAGVTVRGTFDRSKHGSLSNADDFCDGDTVHLVKPEIRALLDEEGSK